MLSSAPDQGAGLKRSNIPDYYSILTVTPSSKQSEIVKAYRTLVGRYHPDKHSGNELKELAEEKLRQLNEAYETLSDPDRRAAYDRERNGSVSTPFGVHTSPKQTVTTFPFNRTLKLLAFIVAVFISMRFFRNPRAMILISIALAIAWFGPGFFKMFKKK